MIIPSAADATVETKPVLLPPPTPLDGFAAAEFKARRQVLRSALPDGIILIRGATEDEVPHGAPLRYRQNGSFFYLTGIDTPGAFLALLPEGVVANAGLRNVKPDIREILFLPSRDAAAEQWTGPKLGPGEETQKLTGIELAVESDKLWGALSAWIRRCPVVQMLAPIGEHASDTRQGSLMHRIAGISPAVQFRDCSMTIGRQRIVKSPSEIEAMWAALAVTDAGHRAARQFIARGTGRREYEVEAKIFEAFRSSGGVLAFSSIVGTGVNGAILHYDKNDAELKAGDLVVVDIGARVGHYCGDVTRTYPIGGVFEPRRREIYELVFAAQRHAVSQFKVGQDSLDSMTERCKAFLKQSPARSKDATMETFMPHSLGHHLGLDVHDVNDCCDRHTPLPIGSIITIEPGIYLPHESIGVRIEDDFLVTENGLERVGEPLEVEVAELERVMK